MSESTLRSTLLLLQNKTRRDPDAYREEFLAQLEHFDAQCRTVGASVTGAGAGGGGGGDAMGAGGGKKDRSLISAQFIAVANYISHVAHCYPDKCAQLPDQLIALLRNAKTQLSAEARLAIVKDIMLLRSKDLVGPEKTLPVFFELLLVRDKTLRHLIIHHIIGDVKKIHLGAKAKSTSVVSKKVQAHLFAVADEDDAIQARCALLILMDLYNRNIWADQRTVEVISKGCFSKHSRIIQASLRFFLMQLPKLFTGGGGGSDSESDDNDPGRQISKLKQKLKVKKKTGKRERILDREVGRAKRKYDTEAREQEKLAKLSIDPMRFLRDAQGFAERLFAKMQKTTERFETRILYLNVLARVVAEHEVIVLPLYTFLERYMEPTQAKVTQILALTAACVHKLVPPDALTALVKTIANHFVNDRSDADSITIGINTIREICKRQPMAITSDLLADLVEYKQQRGDRGVMMAARALLQLYREIQPSMLPAKLRGSTAGAATDVAPLKYGASSPLADIPGMELLLLEKEGHANGGLEDEDEDARALLEAMSSDDDDFDGSDDESSAGSASWCSVSSGSSGVVDLDAPPKLVPVNRKDLTKLTAQNLEKVANVERAKGHPGLSTVSIPSSDEEETLSEIRRRAAKKRLRVSSTKVTGGAKQRILDDDFWVVSEGDHDEDDMWDADDEEEEEIVQETAPNKKRPRYEQKSRTAPRAAPVAIAQEEEDDEEEDEEIELDDDEEEEGEWEEGEWVPAGEDSDDDEEAEEEEFEEEEAEEEEEKPKGSGDFFEDVSVAKASSRAPTAATTTNFTAASKFSSSTHFLTEDDFARLTELKARAAANPRIKKKVDKATAARQKKRDALLHDTSMTALDDAAIATFTERKRNADREDKIERTQALRAASNPFNIAKKRKSKINATHSEHNKRGKLFQMTKRSARVGAKMKRSITERGKHKKELKKKDIKFRIKRGWKA